jgi:hypothetical protein
MRKRTRTDTALCLNFCTYYKPGRNEELACQGYVVVQRLISGGRRLSQERPAKAARPNAATLKGLQDRVCLRCSFREQDCDYIATGGNAPSCGGFLLLSHLLGTGELTLDEIE